MSPILCRSVLQMWTPHLERMMGPETHKPSWASTTPLVPHNLLYRQDKVPPALHTPISRVHPRIFSSALDNWYKTGLSWTSVDFNLEGLAEDSNEGQCPAMCLSEVEGNMTQSVFSVSKACCKYSPHIWLNRLLHL